MNTDGFTGFVKFLNELEQRKISYTLAHNREDALMVIVATPGERWEIEFLHDGSIEIEKFMSTGEITGAEGLEELFAKYEDQDSATDFPEKATGTTRVGKVA